MSSPNSIIPILITGVGDTVGQALVKAARLSKVRGRVLGSDRDALAVGLRWVDKGVLLPHCSNVDAYLCEICRTCAHEGVKLILPGSEKELLVLAEHADAIRKETGAIIAASPSSVLQLALNKWEICRFLEHAGLNHPRYALADSYDQMERLIAEAGFPLIAKPFHGTGAIGVVKLESAGEVEKVRAFGRPMVIQEYLQPAEEEYSVEVYTLRSGKQVGAISYRREQLIAGDTYKAHVAQNEAAIREARAVAGALSPTGPCNVQLRVTARGPVTFEVNPRFSGGVAMRAHFGYNEVEMALRDLVRHEPVPAPRIGSGWAMRFWEEIYYDDEAPLAPEPPPKS